jgi:murein DD-endopeptidase MepM/ murein hydrolase activator NlpD
MKLRVRCALLLLAASSYCGEGRPQPPEAPAGPRIVRQQDGWPLVFELNVGETMDVPTPSGARAVKLLAFEEFTQPDHWIKENASRKIIAGAKVSISVDNEPAVLTLRPYQWPLEFKGLRLFVETTRNWASTTQLTPCPDVRKDIRFSAVAAGQPWGPTELKFPINNFRFRASSYQNTWCSLVPYNKFYYHRGEDLGAIPGRLDVVSMLPGEVTKSPLPEGDTKSNSVSIKHSSGAEFRYAHMDIENINPKMDLKAAVEAGDVLGKTGMTWNGQKTQTADPHLHVQLDYRETTLALWPFMIEAYFRSYPDGAVAIAGGYQFAEVGQDIVLDGSRSIARSERKIVSYQWRMHDGKISDEPYARLKCDKRGLFSEELIIKLDDGSEERDYLQVRVYDPKQPTPIARGWMHYAPTRGIRPETDILFWNRFTDFKNAQIDFGDGTRRAFSSQIVHKYKEPGLYTITATGTGPYDEPATVRLRLIVEKP